MANSNNSTEQLEVRNKSSSDQQNRAASPYQGLIKLSIGNDHQSITGQVVASDINKSGVGITMLYTDSAGNQETKNLMTDANGYFIDQFNRLINGYSIVVKSKLPTPLGTTLDICTMLIQQTAVNAGYITEDAGHCLVTEAGQYFSFEV